MKPILLSLFVCLSFYSIGQDTIPTPEFTARPYYLKNGTLENLEKSDANFDMKAVGGGYGGTEEYLMAFNAKSNVRFTKDQIPAFYVRFENAGDPSDLLTLSLAEIKKDRRRFKTASTTLTGKARNASDTKVGISFKKVRDGVYLITFDASLQPGEYAFLPPMDLSALMSGGKFKLFCFGVD